METLQKPPRVGDLPDHYRILGVTPAATFREIEAAYWRLVFGSSQTNVAALNAAYEVMGNDERRRAYDAQRRDAGLDAQSDAPAAAPPAPETQQPGSPEPSLRSRLGWPSV